MDFKVIDIYNLLNKNEDSYEFNYALTIRNTTENIKIQNLKIEELKQQIIQIETLIKQLRTILDVKENNATMLDIIRSIRESKQKQNKEMSVRNVAVKNIEDLERKKKCWKKRFWDIKMKLV